MNITELRKLLKIAVPVIVELVIILVSAYENKS
jgi:hypothetical protein